MRFPSPTDDFPLRRAQRRQLFLSSLVVLAGFALAWAVRPDPRGFGTHQQFGLPPCTFQYMFGIPCPSCGGTTTFAHFARGQWSAALRTNPAAFGLALASLAYVPWAWLSCWHGRLLGVRDPSTTAVVWMIGLSALAVVQWGVRLCL